ncbi:lactococcin 972 family bacteriocin [Diaminobutyricibacter sp. McL0608]|uniref:lactococcin 972 family bacteriocin n=1 Tax=Leifsonia sp. McL0608 TaxID=3143537 RepID=UPI0031F2DDC3
MRTKIRFAAVLVAAAAMVSLPVTAANASTTSTNAGGGLWQYGVDSGLVGKVFSNYHHATKNHTATACDGSLAHTCKQAAAIKGAWAKASTNKSNGGNTAFWNTL